MIASHNQKSVELAISSMDKHGLTPTSGVYFGQLLGMSDNLSFGLGNFGFKVYKYVPYGPVREIMPYLIRRAQENSDALGGAKNEVLMIDQELKSRLFNIN
jgi:proline dehydrogenase